MPDQRILIEYKPFEPAFYHTDIADWGMALELARVAPARRPRCWSILATTTQGDQHRADCGVADAYLDALGGFHFNDRKYADDDLTLGSIDPYQVFRIFHELLSGGATDVAPT